MVRAGDHSPQVRPTLRLLVCYKLRPFSLSLSRVLTAVVQWSALPFESYDLLLLAVSHSFIFYNLVLGLLPTTVSYTCSWL